MRAFIFKCAKCNDPIIMNLIDEDENVEGFITYPSRFLAEMALETERTKIKDKGAFIVHKTCGSVNFDIGEFEIKLV